MRIRNWLLVIILGWLAALTACTAQPAASPGRIYFSRDETIWVFDVASGQETLLLNRFLTQEMRVSPDGKWLAYQVPLDIGQRTNLWSIWVADARTGREMEIVHQVPASELFWLPDSRLMVVEYPDWNISSDGTQLTKGEARHTIFDPRTERTSPASWYVTPPDNGRVFYAPTFDCAAEEMFGPSQDVLRVSCLDAREPITIATPLSLGGSAWSSDGKQLSFTADYETRLWDAWSFYVWQRDTNTVREINLRARGYDVGAESWSPDNQWVAFQSDRNLCVLNVADEKPTCFHFYLTGGGIPVSWSPNSRQIVIATWADRVCKRLGCDCSNPVLVAVDVPSGEVTKLADNVRFAFTPLWGR